MWIERGGRGSTPTHQDSSRGGGREPGADHHTTAGSARHRRRCQEGGEERHQTTAARPLVCGCGSGCGCGCGCSCTLPRRQSKVRLRYHALTADDHSDERLIGLYDGQIRSIMNESRIIPVLVGVQALSTRARSPTSTSHHPHHADLQKPRGGWWCPCATTTKAACFTCGGICVALAGGRPLRVILQLLHQSSS
jgi:hypothetical protein